MSVKIPSHVSKKVDIAVSLAAAIVILGALFKILHKPSADIWLQVGLYTEAFVFLIYGVLYIKYPAEKEAFETEGGKSEGPLQSIDKMMKDGNLTPELFKKLGDNFQKLGTTVAGISDVSEVVKSTSDFGAKTKEASAAMAGVATAANASAASMNNFNAASQSAKGFHEQVQVLTKNLSSLNTIYELELKESNNHLKTLNQFYGKLAEASNAMVSTVDDAKKAKEQIAALAGNLSKLNTVYGGMIAAMQGR